MYHANFHTKMLVFDIFKQSNTSHLKFWSRSGYTPLGGEGGRWFGGWGGEGAKKSGIFPSYLLPNDVPYVTKAHLFHF